MKKPKLGRPTKPPEERRSVLIVLRVTEEEKATIDRACNRHPLSEWCRNALLRAAERFR